jgi:hypothetical protein
MPVGQEVIPPTFPCTHIIDPDWASSPELCSLQSALAENEATVMARIVQAFCDGADEVVITNGESTVMTIKRSDWFPA